MARMWQVVDRAFESVGVMFGGIENMPDVTQQTLDALRQRFDDFAEAAAEAAARAAQNSQDDQSALDLLGA